MSSPKIQCTHLELIHPQTEGELERVKALASQHQTHIQALTLQQETNIRDLEAKNKKLSSTLRKCRDSPVRTFVGMGFEKLSSVWSKCRVSPSRLHEVGIWIGLSMYVFLFLSLVCFSISHRQLKTSEGSGSSSCA